MTKRKLARIDGRIVSQPVINAGDTSFTVSGSSPWGSSSEYEVHLKGPDSYYTYDETREIGKDYEGNTMTQKVKVTGNDADRIQRYRNYIQQLNSFDYKTWLQDLLDGFKSK